MTKAAAEKYKQYRYVHLPILGKFWQFFGFFLQNMHGDPYFRRGKPVPTHL